LFFERNIGQRINAKQDDVGHSLRRGANMTSQKRWKEKGRKEVENHGEDLTGTL
jgi:hypothetical protein